MRVAIPPDGHFEELQGQVSEGEANDGGEYAKLGCREEDSDSGGKLLPLEDGLAQQETPDGTVWSGIGRTWCTYADGRPTPRLDHPPRILIALAGHRWAGREGAIERDFDTLLGESAPNDYFSEVFFLDLHDSDHRKTYPLLIDHAQSVRRERHEASTIFSVKHLNALFDRALDTVSSFPRTSFDCLSAARQDFPVDPDMAIHLENFISQISAASQLRTFAAPVVASSILLDQYLPEMHLFKPAEVFQKLYSKTCLQVAKAAFLKGRLGGLLLPSVFCSSVLADLESLFAQLLNELVVRIRPPTAGHGILCIDGGGVGGIIPSTILELVQDRLDLPIPVQEHFSMAYGVSVGGLVILGLYFPLYYVPEVGVLQDGGVVRNNPTIIGLAEFSKLTADTTPDYVVNLGTGSLSEPDMVIETSRVKSAPREDGYYRLDIKLQGSIPLDDTSSMPLLRSLVLRDAGLRAVVDELAQRFFAALFYFELSAIPSNSSSRFRIQGQMMCMRKAGDPALARILERLASSFLSIDGKEMRIEPTTDIHGNVQLVLDFTAGQCIDMKLREGRSSPPSP
ncbi:hypothetical protein PG994_010198 [Apiospora phragmitis]|uniref:PNPLA domain-containing protein n=1 Tax=Apiospora phragmitis TaxID=2905665 RepID=A0ABR1TRW6_9PEZI